MENIKNAIANLGAKGFFLAMVAGMLVSVLYVFAR